MRDLYFFLRAAVANLAPNLHQTRAIFDVDLRVFVAKRAATAAKTCASASRVLQNVRDAQPVILHFFLRVAVANLAPNLHQTRAIFDADLRVFVAKLAATAAKTCTSASRVLQNFS